MIGVLKIALVFHLLCSAAVLLAAPNPYDATGKSLQPHISQADGTSGLPDRYFYHFCRCLFLQTMTLIRVINLF